MRMEDELLADARREADHAREELIKARDLLAQFLGAYDPALFADRLPCQKRIFDAVEAFMAETTLYPKAPIE